MVEYNKDKETIKGTALGVSKYLLKEVNKIISSQDIDCFVSNQIENMLQAINDIKEAVLDEKIKWRTKIIVDGVYLTPNFEILIDTKRKLKYEND